MPYGFYKLPIMSVGACQSQLASFSLLMKKLQYMPDVVSAQDVERLNSMRDKLCVSEKIPAYEEMIERYSHPFFMGQLANMLALLHAGQLALRRWQEAQAALNEMGINDEYLDILIQTYAKKIDEEAEKILAQSRQLSYYQLWRPTDQHRLPSGVSEPSSKHHDVLRQWNALAPAEHQRYLRKLAIETNEVEGVFYLTQGSQDRMCHGSAGRAAETLPHSPIHDAAKIHDILDDTLAAYNLVHEVVEVDKALDKRTICEIHARLMRTCRFTPDKRYIAPGETRTATRKTVIVGGARSIQFCPFPDVDRELEHICDIANIRLQSLSGKDPFLIASWIHLILVRCHPFEDGNGRLTRMIASMPLLTCGYPPMSISLAQRAEYYDAINKSYYGDHTAMVQCIKAGIQETIRSVEAA